MSASTLIFFAARAVRSASEVWDRLEGGICGKIGVPDLSFTGDFFRDFKAKRVKSGGQR